VIEAQPDCLSQPFIVMATDYLIPEHFVSDVLDCHQQHHADVTVSLKRVPIEELASRSSVRFDPNDNILEVVEKPEPGTAPSDLSANLVFVLPPSIVPYVTGVKASPRGERELQSAINAFLADGGTARGLVQDTPNEWSPSRQ